LIQFLARSIRFVSI